MVIGFVNGIRDGIDIPKIRVLIRVKLEQIIFFFYFFFNLTTLRVLATTCQLPLS